MIFSSIFGASKVVGNLAWQAPNLILQKRRAARQFRAQLIADGLDEDAITELTKAYLELGNMKDWLVGLQKDAE